MRSTSFLLFTALLLKIPAQQATTTVGADPLEMKVAVLELRDETLGEALGQLNQSFDISISIEGVLPEQGTTANPKFSARVENRTLAQVLDWLCVLDGRYTWTRDGNNVNLFPKASQKDPNYFFNHNLAELQLRDIRRVSDAVIALDHQANDPSGGVIYMGIGQKLGFGEPWTVSFTNVTVRQALNRIAQKLGPTYGWQIGGTTKARLIIFHYKLEAPNFKTGNRKANPCVPKNPPQSSRRTSQRRPRGGKFVVMDLSSWELFTVSSTSDAELKNPMPLQFVAGSDAGKYRLYKGRESVKLLRIVKSKD